MDAEWIKLKNEWINQLEDKIKEIFEKEEEKAKQNLLKVKCYGGQKKSQTSK